MIIHKVLRPWDRIRLTGHPHLKILFNKVDIFIV